MKALWGLALATQAAAACPDPAALATGITVVSEAQRATYRQVGDGIQARTLATDGSATLTQTLAFGLIAQLTTADFADPAIPDQQTALILPVDLSLPPAPGEMMVLPARVTDLVTGQSDGVIIHLTAGDTGQIRIGDCLLEALQVALRVERPGATYQTDLVWLADYGFAYQARVQFQDFPATTFAPTAIIAE
jgi:hypothetical protein